GVVCWPFCGGGGGSDKVSLVKSCRCFHRPPIRRRPQNRMPQNSDAAMSEPLRPREPKQVEEAIAWALAHGKTLELLGHGSKRAIGRAAQWDATLDLS